MVQKKNEITLRRKRELMNLPLPPKMSFFGRLGVPLGRASGEKCFLNPIGFRKFFECFIQSLCERFCGGWGKWLAPSFTRFLTLFFYLLKYAVKWHKIFFNEISSRIFFRIFFNEISSGNFF